MPLFSLKLPAGFLLNGTMLQAQGRWRTGTLVRFVEGSLRPLGGWEELTAEGMGPETIFTDTFVDEGDGTDLPDHTPTGGGTPFVWLQGSNAGDDTFYSTFFVDTDTGYTDVALLYPSAGWGATKFLAVNVTSVDSPDVDYSVEATVRFPGTTDRNWELGVFLRSNEYGEACYRATVTRTSAGAGTIRFDDLKADGSLRVPAQTVYTITPDVEHTLRLDISGTGASSVANIYWDDVLVVESNPVDDPWWGATNPVDYHNLAGRQGVYGRKNADAGTGQVWLADFTVSSADQRSFTLDGVPRCVLAWRGNDGSSSIGIGTNTKLYAHWLGILYDITPSGFTAGTVDAALGQGDYGDGLYGVGLYGEGDPNQTTAEPPATWQLDTFGDYLVGVCSPNDGKLYYWDRNSANIAVVMTNAPTDCTGIVVTPERYVVALGAGGQVRDVQWAAQESLTNWTESGTAASGTLTAGATPANNDTVTVGSKTYTFKTTIGTADGEVLINGSAANALINLKKAVNLTGSPGVDYTSATTANTQVSAGTITATTLLFTALNVGTAGNLIPSTETGSNLSFTGTTLSGGVDDGGAGSFTLEGKGSLLTGRRGKGETLLWTTDEVYAMRYIGGTLIYAFECMGRGCGLIAPNAVAQPDVKAVWMGPRGFFLYDGYVQALESEVSDYVFSDFNVTQAGKVTAYNIAQFGQVRWHYPSSGSDENDRYVDWNYRENLWSVGELERTAGCDAGAIQYPVYAAANGKLYEHEKGVGRLDVDGSTVLVPYAESGPAQLGDGDQVLYVSQLIPDEKNPVGSPGVNLGNVELSLYTSFYPGEAETLHGPFTIRKLTDARFTGRWVRQVVTEVEAGDWRYGETRVDGVPGGRR